MRARTLFFAVVVSCSCWLAAASGADFADGIFTPGDWTISVYAPPGSSATIRQELEGANNYQRITQVLAGPANIASVQLKLNATYTPNSQGAIAAIDYSELARVLVTEPSTFGGSTAPALRQGGNVYAVHSGSATPVREDPNGPQPSAYRFIQFNGLTAAHFVLVTGPMTFDTAQHPNFSANGTQIEFGFVRYNSHTGGSTVTRASAIDNWRVTVSPNTPPTISDIANQSTSVNTPTGAIPFSIGDTETPANSLAVTASSSNPTLVPPANMVFGGSGANRTLTITPATGQAGTTTITVTVTDANGLTAFDQFIFTVAYVVTHTGDSGAGSLRQAILDANNHLGADTISFNIPDAQNTWTTKTPMPFVSAAASGAVIGDVFYAVCQDHPHLGEPSRLQAYDPATDSWVSKAAMFVPRHTVAVGVGADRIYIAGGWDGASDRGELEEYNPTSNAWTNRASMPKPVRAPAGAVLNGIFYVTGGSITYPQPATPLNTVYAYNPVTGTWSTRAPMPTARAAHGVAAINGILYAVGGFNATAALSTLEAYDPVANTWTTKAPMPTARGHLSVTVLNGLLVAAGGAVASSYLATVEVYDPATDSWATLPSMPTARANPALAALGGKIYAAGGSNPTGSLSALEAFTPDHTIAPLSPLPTITDPVIIDGYTQPGASENTLANGNDAVLKIELSGANITTPVDALRITAGNTTIRGLVINRFRQHGIVLENNGGNVIEGNFIGTDITGTVRLGDLGNDARGVYLFNIANNRVGGTTPEARNLISGNDIGIAIEQAGAADNLVEGNFIGTDITGRLALGNSGKGIYIDNGAHHNVIGGIVPGARNIISGNGYGIEILRGATANRVLSNFIGTDVNGSDRVANSLGLLITSPGNLVGGDPGSEGNLISGNIEGLRLSASSTSAATGNMILGNRIGTDVAGNFASGLGNQNRGILIDGGAANNTIGNATGSDANVIAGNGTGIDVRENSTVRNSIRRNSIFSNAGLGIDLAPAGANANDPGDGDAGPNNLQNFPVITSATYDGVNLTIQYSVNSTTGASDYPLAIEFFIADATAQEGKTLIGTHISVAPGPGTTTFAPGAPVNFADQIVATATDANGNTSEFSPGFDVNTPPTLSAILTQSTARNTALEVAFTVGDLKDPAGSLIVTALSLNQTLVPNINLIPGGAGASRTLTVQPASGQGGVAIIKVIVTDTLGSQAETTFVLRVGVTHVPGFLLAEVYHQIPGRFLSDLAASPKFPALPDQVHFVPRFEYPHLLGECYPDPVGTEYGVRLSGLFVPTTTGNHIFFMNSDDQGRLFLSSDDNPVNKQLIAFEPEWNNSRQWLATDRRNPLAPENRSTPVALVAGKQYYIEALMKQGGGGHNLAVTVILEGEPFPANDSPPLSGNRIGVLADLTTLASAITIIDQPADVEVPENQIAVFRVLADGTPADIGYQWQKALPLAEFTDIPEATQPSYKTKVALADNETRYRVVMAVLGRSAQSQEAILTVAVDNAPPIILGVMGLPVRNEVRVVFSEPMDAEMLINPLNYSFGNSLAIVVATALSDRVVALTVSGLIAGSGYVLTVNNLLDAAAAPNVIVPIQKGFQAFTPSTGAVVAHDGHVYQAVLAPAIAWTAAETAAAASTLNGKAGHLATLPEPDSDFLADQLRRAFMHNGDHSAPELWVGGRQVSPYDSPTSGWMWVNDEGTIPGANCTEAYANWNAGEPNDYSTPLEDGEENHMAIGWANGFVWNDEGASPGSVLGYMIEYDPTPPTISNIADQSTSEDTPTAAIAFSIDDLETGAASLTLSGSSSNPSLVPNANIVFGGSGASRTVTITPAPNQFGTATITIGVADADGASSSDTFLLTVSAVNDLPTISDIADQSTSEDTPTAAIAFSIGDLETAAASLSLGGTSSNPTLVPNTNIVFGGSGASRTVTASPAANQSGNAVITVTVTDGGGGSRSDTFLLTVTPVNDPPTFTKGADPIVTFSTQPQSIPWATAISPGPVDEAGQTVDFIVSNDFNALFAVPPAISPAGVLTFTPASGANGLAQLTVSLHDNGGGGTDTGPAQGFIISMGCPDNDSWPRACPLTVRPLVPDVYGAEVLQSLDELDQTMWYKFHVIPGSKLVVTLTDLPADYDLFVFKDIGAAYNTLTSEQDLLRLTAEYAPSAFSPSAFSDDVYAPSAFSPSAFSPSAFSLSAFSPSAFSPSAFSPSAFSPSAFSPSAFSPSAFSDDTDAFAPSAFSPSAFSPSAFSPSAFSGAQTRSLLAISAFSGAAGEGIIVNTWENSGDFYISVRGRNGAFAPGRPYHLQVTLYTGDCKPFDPLPVVHRTALPAGNFRTLILTDLARTEGTLEEKGLLQQRLAAFAARQEVQGFIVDVGADAAVSAANQQADANPLCPYGKNLVAEAIKNIIDFFRAYHPLEYIVLVGNDHVIPFVRHPDSAGLANEKNYVPPVLDDSSSQASLKNGNVLGQDAYGSICGFSVNASTFPIADLAVGRLVENAAEIIGMIDAYLTTTRGVISKPTSSLVTGYDFLVDAAHAIQTELMTGIGTGEGIIHDALIAKPTDSPESVPKPISIWDALELRNALLGSRHDIIFLAGHYNASSALAADWKTHLFASEAAAAPVDLANTIIFGAGCHFGYNIVNPHGVPEVTFEPDWPQAFAFKRVGALIGGTGYQYGDTEFVEYNERLYREFARQLRVGTGPIAVGKALVAAKKHYLKNTPLPRGIHEKAVLEVALFGFPMLSVDMPAGRGSDPVNASIVPSVSGYAADPGLTLGLKRADVTIQTEPLISHVKIARVYLPDGSFHDTNLTWLSGADGQVSNPAEPVLPLVVRNVTMPDLVLRGVGFRGGDYTHEQNVRPLTGAPATEVRGVATAFYSEFPFPTRNWNVNYLEALCDPARGETLLNLFPAQYQSDAPLSDTGTRRRYQNMSFRLFYSGNITTYDANTANPSTPALSDAPSISGVTDEVADGGNITFQVHVVGNPAAGIQEVWITYTDLAASPAKWQSFNLVQNAGDSTLWEGSLTAGAPAQIRYMVQAVNGVGLVSLDTKLGYYYTPTRAKPAPPQPTGLLLTSIPVAGQYGAIGTFSAALIISSDNTPAGAGQVITFGLGSRRAQGVTDANGTASVDLQLLDSPGSYTVQATFAGTDQLAAASATGSLEIKPQATMITLVDSDPGVDVIKPQATLKDAAGNVLPEKTVFFVVSQGAAVLHVAPVITDFAGRAILGAVPVGAGTYLINATFNQNVPVAGQQNISADERYLGSSAPPLTVTYTARTATIEYTGQTVVAITEPLHLAAKVNSAGDLTLALVEFVFFDLKGNRLTTVVAPVAADGISLGAITGFSPGVYAVRATVVGSSYTSAQPALANVAAYDPNAGGVTAGAWFNSPAGAYPANPSLKGRVSFGLTTKYLKNQEAPSGETEIQIRNVNFDFKSTSYDWLIVLGARAQLHGSGTIGGKGNFGFSVTVIDAQIAGGGIDKCRIKIWDKLSNALIYDNEPGGPDSADPVTVIGGGSIAFHK